MMTKKVPKFGPFLCVLGPFWAQNDIKCISLEPNIVWTWLVPIFEVVSSQKNDEKTPWNLAFFGRFRPVFWHFFTLFDILVNLCHFSPYLVISEILQLFVICCHFLPFFTIFWHFLPFLGNICIWMHVKAFKSIFSCFSPLYQFLVSFSYYHKSFLPVLSQLSKTLRLFLPFSAILLVIFSNF